jgi:TPR repeat protein
MKAETRMQIAESILNPACPWKLPRLKWEFPKYPYKKTLIEWRALLALAKQGDAEAEYEVAALYDDGCKTRSGKILVRPSGRKALEWYRRSAAHGNTSAQTNLGVILSSAKASKEDRREALMWLKQAARAEYETAIQNTAIVYRENGDLRQAVHWFRKSAALGDDGARIQLGIHCYWGRGIRADHSAAIQYWRMATKGKNLSEAERDDAFFYLGIAYLEGKGVRSSLRMAQKLLQRANIDNDHPAALRLLNQMEKSSAKR